MIAMDPDVIKGLDPLADPNCHSKALAYFEQLKTTNEGLEFCASALVEGSYQEDHINFFFWQVYEHQLKSRYVQLPANIKQGMKMALMRWLQTYSKHSVIQNAVYLRNKTAQVFALIFSLEYLNGWPTFIQDVMVTALGENSHLTEGGANIYLKILLAIDSEVVDRTIDQTNEVQSHNQLLKDTMRERCVPEMVKSWLAIFQIASLSEENTCLCLQVVGAYVTWIDINLIANDRVMPIILGYLSRHHSTKIRESACECLKEIATKGMMPADKLTLVETLWRTLESSGVFQLLNDDSEIDFIIKLSRLVASMTSTLIFAWNKQIKTSNGSVESDKIVAVIKSSIDSKLPVCLQFFEHEDDDVSAQCIDLLRDYLDLLKKTPSAGANEPHHMFEISNNTKDKAVEELFFALVKKLKYDEDYDFTKEGESEAEFQEFLRSIKVIFDNLAQFSPNLVVAQVHSLLSSALKRWQNLPFNDVEVAIRLLYMLGESIPSNLSTQFTPDKSKPSPLYSMMTELVTSGVSNHPHSAIRMQFFETVARYDRYFSANHTATIISETTEAFFDQRGLRSDDPRLRSRCAYLMSRYVKTLGKLMNPYAVIILNQLGHILVLDPVNGVERLLSNDDQLFIYELAGNLIVNSHFEPDKKASLMTALLRPLVENFQSTLEKMKLVAPEEVDLPHGNGPQKERINKSLTCATTLNYMMSYASRTSKAFSNKLTMSQSGCAPVYTDALKVFLQALDTHIHRTLLHTGVRQYLHRMVICLEDEVLPFVPLTIHHLLSNQESRSLHDFIPLLNQVINKFKTLIEPFLREVFMLVVRAIFDMLSRQASCDALTDEDIRLIRRTYFQFLVALVTNNVANVILLQETRDLQLVLSTLVQGAVESHDPVSQKMCFSVLSKLIQNWGGDATLPLHSFIHESVVPACFMAPMSPHFDLNDAQTVLALNESASLIGSIHKQEGVRLENFLRQQYLPSLQLPPEKIEEYCQALKLSENRAFRAYLKAFFTQAKT